jgi:diacylglycerol O-acyltransferase / wax synthase
MQRLTGLDAGFLSMETSTAPMHVAGLAIFDASEVGERFDVQHLRKVYEPRLHLAAPFRRRLREVPFGLHHPLWIEDPDFDIGWHLRHVAVPAPGGPRELAELAARLNAIPLDRSRPLWEMWLIDGVAGGHVAVLSKVHHAAIDGASGNEITVATLDLSPEGNEVPPPEKEWEPDSIPSDAEMLAHATRSLLTSPIGMVKATRRSIDSALGRRALPRTAAPPSPFAAPKTSINGPLSRQRVFAATSLSLPAVKAIKAHHDVKVNDVVLALCAGALRRWFDERGEDLSGPLVAMVPVSVRTESEKGAMGNRVSSMLVSLATEVSDPAVRLQVIGDATREAKERHAIGADALTDWAEFAAPALLGRAARLYSRMQLANRHRPVFNVTISNVPGPPFPLYSAGARLVANYPMGPIFDGAGLNMTVMSYMDQLDFGLQGDPQLLGDPWILAGHLEEALAELAATVPELDGETLVIRPFGASPERPVELTGGDDLRVIEGTEELIARAQAALDRAHADRADAAAITAALEQLRRAADFSPSA